MPYANFWNQLRVHLPRHVTGSVALVDGNGNFSLVQSNSPVFPIKVLTIPNSGPFSGFTGKTLLLGKFDTFPKHTAFFI